MKQITNILTVILFSLTPVLSVNAKTLENQKIQSLVKITVDASINPSVEGIQKVQNELSGIEVDADTLEELIVVLEEKNLISGEKVSDLKEIMSQLDQDSSSQEIVSKVMEALGDGPQGSSYHNPWHSEPKGETPLVIYGLAVVMIAVFVARGVSWGVF